MENERLYQIINPGQEYNPNNLRFQEMMYMINASGIPTHIIGTKLVPDDVDYEQFVRLSNIQNNIQEFVSEGNNLYIFSQTCGNGKTTWAIKLILQYFNEVWACNNFKERGLFINVPTFLTKIKAVIGHPDEQFEKMRNLIESVDVVVWDDIASTKLSDFDYNTLLTYIDKRTLEGKCNIYTGNVHPRYLESYVGQRLTSRISNKSALVELKGVDRRKQW
jgi:DNA replication protein DnaC